MISCATFWKNNLWGIDSEALVLTHVEPNFGKEDLVEWASIMTDPTIEICFQQYVTLSLQPFCTVVLITLVLVIIIWFTSGFEIKLKNSFSLCAMRVIAQPLDLLILYKNFVVLHLPLPKSYPCWLFIRQPSLHSFAAKMQYAFVKDV